MRSPIGLIHLRPTRRVGAWIWIRGKQHYWSFQYTKPPELKGWWEDIDNDAIETTYWLFDHKKKGRMPMSERDAFKFAVRAMLARAAQRRGPSP